MQGTTTANLGHPFGFIATLTAAHLIVIALVAVVVIAAMLHGAKLARRRAAARRTERDRLAAFDAEHPGGSAAPGAERTPPPAPAEPVTTSVGQEEQRPPVPAPPTPPADPLDAQVPPASAAGSGDADRSRPQPRAQSQAQSQARAQDRAQDRAQGEPGPAPSAAPGDAASGSVTQLKGLGPKVAARLAELGITSVGQIAALDDDAADALDARLGPFQGRIARDRWVEQARFLAAGDRAGFEAVFGRL